MKYGFLLEKASGKKAEHPSKSLSITESGKKDKGLAFLKKGQLITGTVISVGSGVTLDFLGQKVTAPENVLHNAVPGEKKTFEVVKADDKEIELKLLGETNGRKHTFTAALPSGTDWGMLMSQKSREARRAEKEAQYKEQTDKLEEIGAKLTGKDCRLLEKEGFGVENFSVGGLYEAMNRMKAAASGEGNGRTSGTAGNMDKSVIAGRLKAENIPATEENISKALVAYHLSKTAGKLDDKAMQYLISRGAEPSIENIYKACYSGTAQNQPLSDGEWNQLKDQAAGVIKAAGYEVNEENLGTARWLLESKLPLTKETFSYKKELEGIRDNFDQDEVFDQILEGMGKGINPKDISLLTGNEAAVNRVIEELNSIGPEAVAEAVRTGTDLTVRNLAGIQESIGSSESPAEEAPKEAEETSSNPAAEQAAQEGEAKERYKEIRAIRQLEEIRLKMTYEAAAALDKKGFKIETEELSRVVEALKEQEDSYYLRLFKEADAQASEEALRLLKETTFSIGQLKYIPNLVLGITLKDRAAQTIPGLLSAGNSLKAQLDKAGTAYETLMTVPNSEYGDSIKKAFANMDSLLSELNLENTEQSNRAVRALGYNRMDINEETINQVKAYDLQVTTLIKNLQPAVTVRMIKDGLNPLNMPINELNRTIDRIKEEQGITSEEKFSNYLVKLEKENGISEQERKAYIGVYRLLYNIEKSDGAALGAVIKAGQEVTLGNLLTAVQTGKKGRLDAVINDEFGTLQSISRDKESIAQQLSFLQENGEQPDQGQNGGEADTAQAEYLNRILKQMKEELSPEKLMAAGDNTQQTEQGSSRAADVPGTQTLRFTSQQGIWETIKDVPVEKLFDKLQTAAGQPQEEAQYLAKAAQIQELCKNAEQALRFLNDYQVPGTPMNILIANQILSNGEAPIKRLLRIQNEYSAEKSEGSLKDLSELSDKLIDKQSMGEVYEELEQTAKDAVDRACSEEKLDSLRLTELKNLGRQLTFARSLADKEFYQIPIETDSGITNINLTIIRGTEASGRLSVTVSSEKLGNVRAEFSLKDKVLKGFIGSDSRAGLGELQKSTGIIEEAASECSVNLKKLDFGTVQRENAVNYHPDREEGASFKAPETERNLYRIAKAVVRSVRAAENSGS